MTAGDRRLAVVLDGGGAETGATPDRVGGKAAALDRLVAAGVRVPASAAVTTDAYRAFLDRPAIRSLLEDLPDVEDVADPDAEVRRLEEAFAAEPMPDDVERAVQHVVAELDQAGDDELQLAVRSSATVEDASAASYAGQFSTELGCAPGEEALAAIRRVWASAWSPAVRAYRQAVGEEAGTDSGIGMGVVLMTMIDAEHAGVAFTRAPEDRSQIRVEVVEGLGEQLVSGEVTPEVRMVGRHEHRVGDEDLPYLDELVATSLEVEDVMGGDPQDIEWAHDGERLWIVQSRPITVATTRQAEEDIPDDGFDSPLAGHHHTPAGVQEMLPGVLPPLVWTLAGPRLEEAFRHLFSDLGALPVDELDEGHRFVGRFRGRAALDLDLLRAAARKMTGQSEAELERQYFGEVVSEDLLDGDDGGGTEDGGGLRAWLPVLRAARLRRTQRSEAHVVRTAVDRLLEDRPQLGDLEHDEVLRYHHAVLDLGARAITSEVAVAALAAASYRTLERYLERLVVDGAAERAQRLTAGAVPVCKATAFEVCELLDTALDDVELARTLARGEDDELMDRLPEVSGGDEFLDTFHDVIDRAGSARVYAGDRWAERPGVALSTVRHALRRLRRERPDPDARLDELEDELTGNWRWRLTRVLTGQLVDVRIRLLRRVVHDAVELLQLREDAKRTVLRVGGETRRVLEHLCSGLLAEGSLHRRDDFELLGHDELRSMLDGEPGPFDDELERRRRARRDMEERFGTLPLRFAERPGAATTTGAGDGAALRGWGAGPGTHTGRPVVVRDVGDADLHEGDVLVATATDPSWTPLFVTAGAIVVEQGGPLSHAAIVAREFGLPAVLNVPGATDALRDVDEVTVDGTAGTVEPTQDPEADGSTDRDGEAGEVLAT